MPLRVSAAHFRKTERRKQVAPETGATHRRRLLGCFGKLRVVAVGVFIDVGRAFAVIIADDPCHFALLLGARRDPHRLGEPSGPRNFPLGKLDRLGLLHAGNAECKVLADSLRDRVLDPRLADPAE